MSIKYAVLALIVEKPQHGYAVRNAFEARLSDVREIGYGQVYQVLAGLERDGFVRGESPPRGVRKIVYSATRRGQAALQAWLSGAGLARPGFQDDVFLRLLFASPEQRESIIEFLSGQILQLTEDMEILQAQKRSLAMVDEAPLRMRGIYVEAEILHREADLAAIKLALHEIDNLWPEAEPRGVRARESRRSGERASVLPEQDFSQRSQAATSDGRRGRSRFG